jgi:hypothetical protein
MIIASMVGTATPVLDTHTIRSTSSGRIPAVCSADRTARAPSSVATST